MPPNIRPSPSSQSRTIDLLPNEEEVSHRFLNRYRSLIIGIGVLVVLAVGGGVAWQHQENRIHERARIQLAEAQSLEALQAVVRDYDGTDPALLALLNLGNLYYQQNRWDKASEAYQAVLDRYPSSPLAPFATIGMASILETRGQTANALRVYQQAATAYPRAFQAAQIRFSTARLMEQNGQLQEARKVYEDLAVFFPRSSWKSEASARARKLGAQLKKTDSPTVAPVAVPVTKPK